MAHAMNPAAGETVNVTIPRLRTLKVVIRTAEGYGDIPAPFSAESLGEIKAVAANTVESTAKTMRPARRRQAV